MLLTAVAPIGPGFCITFHATTLNALPSLRRPFTKLTRTAVIYAHAASLRDVIAAFDVLSADKSLKQQQIRTQTNVNAARSRPTPPCSYAAFVDRCFGSNPSAGA
jgi:hypothetical protein